MGIAARMMRLIRADLHGVMDQLEDKGLMLKQCLREMENGLEENENRRRQLAGARERASAERERVADEITRLEADLDLALRRSRDDMARFLIRRKQGLENHRDALDRHLADLDRDAGRLGEVIANQRLQYEGLKLKAEDYFRRARQQEWSAALSALPAADPLPEAAEAAVELELLQRKEALGLGGAA